MKKVLFASTALVMAAGVASAEVSLNGEAKMGLVKTGNNTIVRNEIDINVVGSASTDGGLELGASIDLDSDEVDSTTTQAVVNDPEVYVKKGDLKLSVGQLDGALDRGGIADIGLFGIGVDNVAEVVSNGAADHDVQVDYKVGDIAIAASVDSANDDWGMGASGNFGDISFDIAFGESAGADQFLLALGYTSGAFGAKISFEDNSTVDAIGLHLSYTTGDVTINAAFADSSAGGEGWGLGVDYDLGGATLAGGFGEVNGSDNADFGIKFKF